MVEKKKQTGGKNKINKRATRTGTVQKGSSYTLQSTLAPSSPQKYAEIALSEYDNAFGELRNTLAEIQQMNAVANRLLENREMDVFFIAQKRVFKLTKKLEEIYRSASESYVKAEEFGAKEVGKAQGSVAKIPSNMRDLRKWLNLPEPEVIEPDKSVVDATLSLATAVLQKRGEKILSMANVLGSALEARAGKTDKEKLATLSKYISLYSMKMREEDAKASQLLMKIDKLKIISNDLLNYGDVKEFLAAQKMLYNLTKELENSHYKIVKLLVAIRELDSRARKIGGNE